MMRCGLRTNKTEAAFGLRLVACVEGQTKLDLKTRDPNKIVAADRRSVRGARAVRS